MNTIIVELSRYIFVLLILFYVYAAFRGAISKSEAVKGGAGAAQNLMMFVIHFLGYLLLYMKDGNLTYIALYGAQFVFFLLFLLLYNVLYPKASKLLVNNMCMLMAIGFVMLARLSIEKCTRQFAIAASASAISLVVPYLIARFKSFRNMPYLYLVLGIIPLTVLLVSEEIFGAKLALNFGSFSIQPTEFVKLVFVLFVAAMFQRSVSFLNVFATTLFAALHVVILVMSRDLGAALIFFVVYVVMLYDATKKWYYMALGLLSGAAASVIAYRLFAHVRVRVLIWQDPWTYIEDQGYQIAQSLFSIGTGSWFGTGLAEGMPYMIPVPEKDFIFSALCEEFGNIFCIALIFICLSNVVLMMNIASMSKTPFYRLVAVGFAAAYGFQCFLTIGGGIKLIPMTGVTLPFVSYGGSSVTSSVLMFAVVNGLYCMREAKAAPEKKKSKIKKKTKKTEADIGQKREKNVENIVVTVIFSVLFALLPIRLVYYNVVQAPEVLQNSYNTRVNAAEEKVLRGSIMASNGSILAYTEVDESGSEKRVYPYGKVFSHVVGMSTRGKTGIEGLSNNYLLSSTGNIISKAYDELSGKKLSGDNVVTTLDVQLQKAAYLAMENNKGAIVVMEPATGRILAMVSKPDYNPNDAIDQWDTWLSYNSEDSVLLNRAAQGLYPPGSTFKILTALQYVREHPEDYEAYRYSCSGSTEVMTSVIHCYESTAHGFETLKKAFANSCNSSFANIGLEVDGDALKELCEDFMFNRDIPLGIEKSRSGFTMQGDSSVGEKMQTAIGQGKTSITPLHNALIVSAIANGGTMMKPYLVERVLSADNQELKTFEPEVLSEAATPQESEAVAEFMREVCVSGTGRSFYKTSYEVAGKTGTAQFDDTSEESHSWFVGFAPYDNPEIVVSVVLEGGYSVYDSAQEVAKKIFDQYFQE